MQTFTVTAPNTCGLSVIGTDIVYISTAGSLTFAPDTATFSEHLTAQDAADAALVVNASYDCTDILGGFTEVVTASNEGYIPAALGDNVTFNCDIDYAENPGDSGTYVWKDPDGFTIAGATTSSYTVTGVDASKLGTYTCTVTYPSDAYNRTFTATKSYTISAA